MTISTTPDILQSLEPVFLSCLQTLSQRLEDYSSSFGLSLEAQKTYQDFLSIDHHSLEQFKIAYVQLNPALIEKQQHFLKEYYQDNTYIHCALEYLKQELHDFFQLLEPKEQGIIWGENNFSPDFMTLVSTQAVYQARLSQSVISFLASAILLYPLDKEVLLAQSAVLDTLQCITHDYQLKPQLLLQNFFSLPLTQEKLGVLNIEKCYVFLDFFKSQHLEHNLIYTQILSLGTAYEKENALLVKKIYEQGQRFELTSQIWTQEAQISIQDYPYILQQLKLDITTYLFLKAQKYKLDKTEGFVSSQKQLAFQESLKIIEVFMLQENIQRQISSRPEATLSKVPKI